jgi:hypothetical protein
MRLIKMLGLAAVAAMATMAFVGATSASAADTQLCNTHDSTTALTCDSAATSTHWLGKVTFLGSLNIECHLDVSGTPLGLANPQQIHFIYTFTKCKTSEGDDCIVTVKEQPLGNLNKTGLDSGTLTTTKGRRHVECEDVFGGLDVECEYDDTGVQFVVGAQYLTAEETPVDEIGSDFLCPNEPTLDGLLTTTANRYVLA